MSVVCWSELNTLASMDTFALTDQMSFREVEGGQTKHQTGKSSYIGTCLEFIIR